MVNYIIDFFNSEWHKKLFLKGIDISLILLLLSFVGVSVISPEYLNTLQNIIHFYISIILIGRFNPFIKTKIKFDNYDKRFVFASGIALFLSTSFLHIFNNFIKNQVTKNLI